MNAPDETQLLAAAKEAMARAHSPYSGIRVGAAALAADGTIHVGCNVENASLGLTVCAERVAVWSARAAGAPELRLVLFTADHPAVRTPCGACRQVLLELAPRARVIAVDSEGRRREWACPDELLPDAFRDSWAR